MIRRRTRFSRLLAGALINPVSVISNITELGGRWNSVSNAEMFSARAREPSCEGWTLNARLIGCPNCASFLRVASPWLNSCQNSLSTRL